MEKNFTFEINNKHATTFVKFSWCRATKTISAYLIRIGEGRESIIKYLGEEIIRLPDKFVYLIIINQT
jgi:hypothetical protein